MLIIGVLTLDLHIPQAQSLKDRRQVVRALKDKLRRLNVSVAEINDGGQWQRAELAIAVAASNKTRAEQTLAQAEELAEAQNGAQLLHTHTEFL